MQRNQNIPQQDHVSLGRGNLRHLLRTLSLAMLFCPLLPMDSLAVLVAPHALFIDHRERSTVLYVHNPDDHPVEVEIGLSYGYPRGDGKGGIKVFLEDHPEPGEPSCAAWVQALPRRMVLQPRQRQAIRLLARPPAGLPDGEYWSRVIVSSQKAAEPRKLEQSEGVQVGLALATRTIISLNYRKGKVSTGVDLRHMRARVDSAAVHLDLDLHRSGNAAWLGQVDAVLSDASGREVQRWNRALAVYEDLQRSLNLPLDDPPLPGRYTISLQLDTDRADLPPEGILPCPAVVRSMALVYERTTNAESGG